MRLEDRETRMSISAFLKVLRRFVPFLLPVWDKVLLRVIIGLCRSFLTVAMIMMTAKIIDDGMIAKDLDMFWYWVTIYLGIVTVWLFTYIIWLIILHYVNLKIKIEMGIRMTRINTKQNKSKVKSRQNGSKK